MARWSTMTWAGWSTMTFMAIGVAAYGIGGVIVGIDQMIPAMAYHPVSYTHLTLPTTPY